LLGEGFFRTYFDISSHDIFHKMFNSSSSPSHNARSHHCESLFKNIHVHDKMQTRYHYHTSQDFVETKLWTDDADVQSFYEIYYDTMDYDLMKEGSFLYEGRKTNDPKNEREWMYKTNCSLKDKNAIHFIPINETKQSLEKRLGKQIHPFLSLDVDRYYLPGTDGWFDIVSVIGEKRYYSLHTTRMPNSLHTPSASKILAFTFDDHRFLNIWGSEEMMLAKKAKFYITEPSELERDLYF